MRSISHRRPGGEAQKKSRDQGTPRAPLYEEVTTNRAIFCAASQASKAADQLMAFAPDTDANACSPKERRIAA